MTKFSLAVLSGDFSEAGLGGKFSLLLSPLTSLMFLTFFICERVIPRRMNSDYTDYTFHYNLNLHDELTN